MKNSKRFLSLVLSALMLMSMFTMVIGISASAATVWDGTTAESFSSGSGTETDPYIIMSGSELALMASNVNSGIGNGAYYKLGADIVLNENVLDENYNKNSGTFTKWNAIGDGTYVAIPDEITSQDEYDQAKATYGTLYYYYNSSRYFAGYNSNYTTYYYQTLFTGSFDGDNHTISGIYMGDWDSGKSHGLFGYVFGATIKNLRIKDSYSVSNNNDGGGILAVFLKGTDWQNYMTVDNVRVDGRTALCVDPKNMGLFSSYAQYVNFTNCVAYGLSANPLTTGKVGGNYGGFTAATDGVNFTNCVNYAEVKAGTTGGFVARAKTTVFTDCINYGNISCTSYAVGQYAINSTNEYGMAGGFVGGIEVNRMVTFTRCLNEGAVTGKTYAGGFIGKSLSTNTKTFKNSFNKAAVIVTEEKADVLSANSNLTETDIICVSGGIFGYDSGTTTNWSISDTTYDMSGCEVAGTCSDGTAAVTTGDTVTYQSGSWLDDTTLWTVKAGQNPTLTLVAGGSDEHTHSYTSEETKAATCTEKGELTYTCECGDSYTEDTPVLGHNYVNGYCSRCGEKDPDATFFNVTVKGRNGNTVTTEVVSGAEIVLADIAPFAYAYEVTGWTDGEGNAIDTDTITVTADITLVPTFEVAEAYTGYAVTVEGASNTTGGTYQYNDRVTIVFDEGQLSEGQYFGGWVNSYTGAVISYATTYKFYVGADVSIVASIADAETTATPVIAMTDVCDMNGDGSRWSFLSERTVPNGYTYVSSGFIYNTAEITDFTSADNRVKASQSTAKNGQYRLTLNLSSATDVYIIAYLTYTDAEGAEHTVYSGNSTTVHCQKTVE